MQKVSFAEIAKTATVVAVAAVTLSACGARKFENKVTPVYGAVAGFNIGEDVAYSVQVNSVTTDFDPKAVDEEPLAIGEDKQYVAVDITVLGNSYNDMDVTADWFTLSSSKTPGEKTGITILLDSGLTETTYHGTTNGVIYFLVSKDWTVDDMTLGIGENAGLIDSEELASIPLKSTGSAPETAQKEGSAETSVASYKEFSVDEKPTFEMTVNSVTYNAEVPDKPANGSMVIKVNVSVKNLQDRSKYFTDDIGLTSKSMTRTMPSDSGISIGVDEVMDSATIESGASLTGDLYFVVLNNDSEFALTTGDEVLTMLK